jgi:hypothetical protein
MNLYDNDDATRRRLGEPEAKAHREIDDGEDGTPKINDAANVRRRMRQRRGGRPAANFANAHDVDAEFLRPHAKGNKFPIAGIGCVSDVMHDGYPPVP